MYDRVAYPCEQPVRCSLRQNIRIVRRGQSMQHGQQNRKAVTGLHDEVSDYGKDIYAETNGFTVTRCVVSSSL